jgi:arginase
LAFFAYDARSGWIDPPELEWLERGAMARHPIEKVRANPAEEARRAIESMAARAEGYLVHFDIDVTTCPAVDVQHPGSLEMPLAFEALAVFLRDPGCAGLVVTEYNAEEDPSGGYAAEIVSGLSAGLAEPDSA